MIAEAATHNAIWPLLLLVFFVGFFTIAVFVALSERRRKHLEHMSRLPLEDGEVQG